MRVPLPPKPKDRLEVYRFFNGLSSESKIGLDSRRLRGPLVKTFLLEHVSSRNGHTPKHPREIFRDLGAEVFDIDESLVSLGFHERDPETNEVRSVTTGYLERYDERFFAYYTQEESQHAASRVTRWMLSPELDFTWFSSPLQQNLWDQVISKRGDEKFSRIVFSHESIFEMPEDMCDQIEDTDSEFEQSDDYVIQNDDSKEFERRKARFVMADRIGRIRNSLQSLQRTYAPLNVLDRVRFPSTSGKGGHELSLNGQITNRSDSFEEHRNLALYLYKIYSGILEETENCAWQDIDSRTGASLGMKGVPLIIKFAEPITEATFNRWIQLAFQKRNRFKLWGVPIRLGPTKVHVYGADRHLWQPLNLEITNEGLVAILGRGTCGNTFHRLLTNVQHYVAPQLRAWIGSKQFSDLVSIDSVGLSDKNENA